MTDPQIHTPNREAWREFPKTTIPDALKNAIGGHPLVTQTLARRGITNVDAARAFMDPDYHIPAAPSELPGLSLAADLIESAVAAGEHILVWGDFDVDGQTSTTLLVEALRELGGQVSYHIPLRATEGHGIKVEVLEKLITAPTTSNSPLPTVLLTCDTGISAHEAVSFAKARNLTVIITDHHDLPSELPDADAIVNSKMAPEGHPLSTLPGVGVAYKLIEELLNRRQKTEDGGQKTGRKTPSPEPDHLSEKYLDLVALGIVADVALQTGDARYLLQRGLKILRRTPRLGLQTLFENAEIIPDQIDAGQIGFGIGPRLNALGRLSDANPIVEFFTTDDSGRAAVMAAQLEGLNNKRKLLTEQIYQSAINQIETDPNLLDFAALVLAHPQWPAGVIGIVASRLVERFHMPVVLLSSPDGEPARGSARSIEGVHIGEAIAAQAEMLHGFGGHPMAAGLALDRERIADFRRGLSRTIRKKYPQAPAQPSLTIDAYLPLGEITLELADDLNRLAPFGAGNPALILATRSVRLVNSTPIGRDKNHLRLVVEDAAGNAQDILWWRGANEELPEGEFDLAYTVSTHTFRGERRLQLEWQDFRLSAGTRPEVAPEASPLEVLDYRREQHPLPLLNQLKAEGNFSLYTEGEAKRRLSGHDRNELVPAETLILWSAPPGPREWAKILATTAPQRLALFGINPGLDDPAAFLTRLAGLVKHALRAKAGIVKLKVLAAAMASRANAVHLGLAWMEEKGHIRVEGETSHGELQLSAGNEPGHALDDIAMTLKAVLDETAAYRAYFRETSVDSFVRHLETADQHKYT
ncbi:MAG: single-stranded-DNA-specific exonuclease RecJ [Anaerolineae bacterium]|nr:single-stranded-DNA-specific exonuclease RecJ [Anaerolineae bacterium]